VNSLSHFTPRRLALPTTGETRGPFVHEGEPPAAGPTDSEIDRMAEQWMLEHAPDLEVCRRCARTFRKVRGVEGLQTWCTPCSKLAERAQVASAAAYWQTRADRYARLKSGSRVRRAVRLRIELECQARASEAWQAEWEAGQAEAPSAPYDRVRAELDELEVYRSRRLAAGALGGGVMVQQLRGGAL
jgi:hypothetical protein